MSPGSVERSDRLRTVPIRPEHPSMPRIRPPRLNRDWSDTISSMTSTEEKTSRVTAQPRGLRYQKMSDEVADVLQQMIIDGQLQAGQRITQDELSKMLGVSTMPVREALLKLAALGLVEASPNRSFRVVNSTKEDTRDSYWMQSVLVGELTRRACTLEGPKLVPELESKLAAYSAAADAGDDSAMEAAYGGFYRAINLAAQSPRLLFMLRTNLRFVPIRWYPRIEGWIPLSKAAHKTIITAFKRADREQAATIASSHMIQAGELLIEYFESTGRWSTSK
jgi:DNA-binding GntR family transcriptional regulator